MKAVNEQAAGQPDLLRLDPHPTEGAVTWILRNAIRGVHLQKLGDRPSGTLQRFRLTLFANGEHNSHVVGTFETVDEAKDWVEGQLGWTLVGDGPQQSERTK